MEFTNSLSTLEQMARFIVIGLIHSEDKHVVLGQTQENLLEISGLQLSMKYRFGVSAVLSFDTVLSQTFSEWIEIPDTSEKIGPPLDIHAVNFYANFSSVEAIIKWKAPKELPCSYDISWFPMSGESFFEQKTVTIPNDNIPVSIPNLLMGTNYSFEISPYDPSGKRSVERTTSFIVTPCSYGKGSYSKSCSLGPPQNLTAFWAINNYEAVISWKPPLLAFESDFDLHYSLTILKEDNNNTKHAILYEVLSQNATEARVRDLQPSKKYIVELTAIGQGIPGLPATTYLISSEPRKAATSTKYTFLAIVFSTLVVFLVLVMYLWRKSKRQDKILIEKASYSCPESFIPGHLRPYYIPLNRIQLHEQLGRGAFGIVCRGEMAVGKKKEDVAVKEFISPFAEDAMQKLLCEVDLMQILGRHRHIVALRGFSIDTERLLLLLEYCPLKDLHSWLKNIHTKMFPPPNHIEYIDSMYIESFNNSVTSQQGERIFDVDGFRNRILSFMHQIADAMEHIAFSKIVHCDIAARNILLYNKDVVKIADFGLARDVYEKNVYSQKTTKRLPVKWMALETLEQGTFTMWSDIWSFGVLMWEMESFGGEPYPDLRNEDVSAALKQGIRLSLPMYCCNDMYNLMSMCWNADPFCRPTFTDLKTKIGQMLEAKKNYSEVLPCT